MIPKKILFCTDFSENSAVAGDCAARYSQIFGANLTILHVIDSWAGFPIDSVDILAVVGKLEDFAKAQLEQLAKELGRNNGQVETRLTIGIPAEEIVEVANKDSVDLIVMGTHGWTGIRHMLLGSVAEKVLRMATCPVLVVRPSSPG